MKTLDQRLQSLQKKITDTDEAVSIMIIGPGSVGTYLLDYLISLGNPRLKLIVCGRNVSKMESDINIIRTAATIRRQCRSEIVMDTLDLEDVDSISSVLSRHNPDFLVNTSRVYSGLKYGSISWHSLRAYGIWTPLSVKYAANIVRAMIKSGIHPISINTSYSDAVIPWIKSALGVTFDFGSGNLNHLIPRMKFYIARKYRVENLNDIDITLAVSHFHDVVISKEGHSERQDIPVSVKVNGKKLDIDVSEMLRECAIAMPTDQKRNMMNASSNFDIIHSIIEALGKGERIRIHVPGVAGEIGGYPFIIDGRGQACAYFDTDTFTMEEMRRANRKSIYCDGILDVSEGKLHYTPELISKVSEVFGVTLPGEFTLEESPKVAELLINDIIKPSLSER